MSASASTTAPSARSAERLEWVDGAKAIAIVLVVLYHVGTTGMAWLMPGFSDRGTETWRLINEALTALRMPLFFLVSGLLAAGALARPWSALLRPRVAVLLWPFALWTLLFAVPYALYRGQQTVAESVLTAAWTIPLGGTGYWYLFVLVVFFAVCRALRRHGPALLLAGVALLALAPTLSALVERALGDPVGGVVGDTVLRLATFFVWYAVGCFAPAVVARVAAGGAAPLAIAAAGYLVLITLQLVGIATGAATSAALSIAGITTALIGSRLLARWQPARRLGRYLAARTLAIYVVHPVALATLIWLVLRFSGGAGVPPVIGAQWWLTPVLTVALVALSCLLYDVAMRSPLRVLFVPPGRPSSRTTIQASSA